LGKHCEAATIGYERLVSAEKNQLTPWEHLKTQVYLRSDREIQYYIKLRGISPELFLRRLSTLVTVKLPPLSLVGGHSFRIGHAAISVQM
jgi:hypothetical protein